MQSVISSLSLQVMIFRSNERCNTTILLSPFFSFERMTTISFAYAYSFFIFYVLSSQNVQNLILIYKCYILQQQMRVWGEKNIHV